MFDSYTVITLKLDLVMPRRCYVRSTEKPLGCGSAAPLRDRH
jgi:hypothetical protein